MELPQPGLGATIDTVALSVHPTDSIVAIVGHEKYETINAVKGVLAIRDATDGTLVTKVDLDQKPWCVAYSPDGQLLAIGMHKGRVSILETEFYTVRLDFEAHARYVYSVAWMSDGERLVTVSEDRKVKVWDARPPSIRDAERERWLALRETMAARDDLAEIYDQLSGEERAAARAELMLCHPPASDLLPRQPR